MELTEYKGIDYGKNLNVNIDKNGIHYGVINQNEVLQAWADSSTPFYGKSTCQECGNELKDILYTR